ncbi:hypothetical protein RvY_03598-3 [Ramazzottius varieornatus]|uniref:Uncharacterized protein n=1 Tax=Ramazzottius varieornatus TaxID=947166 RepID=A0A1D1UPE9_RAMVA|nr:hypothetical protein RvY_03598-3 [Ramazzottius varieornatus]
MRRAIRQQPLENEQQQQQRSGQRKGSNDSCAPAAPSGISRHRLHRAHNHLHHRLLRQYFRCDRCAADQIYAFPHLLLLGVAGSR